MNSKARLTVATAVALGALAVIPATAQANIGQDDKPTHTYTEQRYNYATGEWETATITEYPDATGGGEKQTSPSQPTGSRTEQRRNAYTGKPETLKITEYPDLVSVGTKVAPAAGTGGLYLRNATGEIEGLMAEQDRAEFISCHPSNPNLAKVHQITHGNGGWGVDDGFVTVSATRAPGQLHCGN
ncbi:hypothetical protein [Streptomyces sp. NBC_01304]|uniref:hypothetical protein n=1 Tax=Streptomyces sp. NBC_01304 TaxID=2903818 RepID=UPI002E0D2821|nr:hypothetical protein OG430_48250 [Streptomyces sp. NBC_01304]